MRLSELLDIQVLQRLADANFKASGMPIGITDVDGTVLVASGWQEICARYHRAHPETLERCRQSDDFIKDHLSEGKPCEYTCKNGLRDIGVPIRVDGQHLATLFSGQFFYKGEAPDRAFFIQQARRFGFDERAYLAALDRVPVLSRPVVENILQYNQALAFFISNIAERALAHARDEAALREADRRKTEFIAVLAHELRNPLAPIRSALHVLQRVSAGADPARRALTVADRQVTHLTRIVDDLLDINRLSRGKYQLRLESLDLARLVADAVEDHRSLFAERGITLDFQSTGAPVWVHGDAARLSQVIGNLLWNASKFTDRRGHVAVTLEKDGRSAAVRVRDDGIGIDAALIEGVFEPFVQADTSLHRTRGGLGLGLALVRGLVELHGGRVSAESGGAGQGSTFIVTLPLVAAAVRAAPAPPPVATKRRILIIEDNEDSAEMLRATLELEGHEVHVAADGVQGVGAALLLRPEVILCDIGLPGIDGYEVSRRVRNAPGMERSLLVAVTGYASSEDVQRAAEAGFHHHFGKPPDVEKLLRVVSAPFTPALGDTNSP